MSSLLSNFASSLRTESAFDVLAVAKQLRAAGKDVIELEIGDSPFPSSSSAVEVGIEAIRNDQCRYAPSVGVPEFRQAASAYVNREYGLETTAENIIAGPGAKNFEQLFCEAFVNPGDGVLVFSPYFPTYPPNIARRGGRVIFSRLRQAYQFRPNLGDVRRFVTRDRRPKAIFLNSPHNPTGGVATESDLQEIAEMAAGYDVAVFSDEPYDRMVWNGEHHTILQQPGMLQRCVAAYTFSKSYSMSGWRLGFAVSSPEIIHALSKLTNTALSCVPPFTQLAGAAVLENDSAERDQRMAIFGQRVQLLAEKLDQLDGVTCPPPAGSFYAFPSVAPICNLWGVTSHGLAMFLLEAADDQKGVACLGGECFGQAGGGFLRFSCAESEERLLEAVEFVARAIQMEDRVKEYLKEHPEYQLTEPYGD